MTENEFLIEYTNRFSKIVTDSIKSIQDSKNLHHNELFIKYIEVNNSINYLGNILISDIMDDFNLDYNHKVMDGFTLVPITSVLLRKSWSIQPKIKKKFDEETSIILKESLCRDFTQDCHE